MSTEATTATTATTANDAALEREENSLRWFLQTFSSWQARVAKHRAQGSESQNIYQDLIHVTVGSDDYKHTFYIHEHLLKMHSPVFQSCLSCNWSEGIKRKIDLPEDDPKIFKLFIRFLYMGYIFIVPKDTLRWRKTSAGGFHRPDIAGDMIIHCYIFADKYLASCFKNACIRVLIDRFMMGPNYFLAIRQNAELVYNNLLPSSALRRLYVDFWVWASTEEWHDDQGNEYHDIHTAPFEFWQDIAKAMTRTRDRLVKVPCDHIIVMHYPWFHDKQRYFAAERAPEPDFQRQLAVDFGAFSPQPEPSDE